MQRQADVQVVPSRSNDSQIALEWKLCDNGFPVDEGGAVYFPGSRSVDWQGHIPPAEEEGSLRALIEERVSAFRGS